MINATGVILAGGKSKRMGINKALVKLGDYSLIEWLILELAKVFHEIIIVANEKISYRCLGLPIINDLLPGSGPLGGIHAALKYTNKPNIFVVGCDMPFVTAEVASYLISSASGYDAVVPFINQILQPVAAVYGKGCQNVIENYINRKKYHVKDCFRDLNIRYVSNYEMEARLGLKNTEVYFYNINTLNELQQARNFIKPKAPVGIYSSAF